MEEITPPTVDPSTSAPPSRGRPSNKSQANPVTVERLATAIVSREHFAVDPGGALYVFLDGCYQPSADRLIARRVKSILKEWKRSDRWASHLQREVAAYIAIDAPTLAGSPPLTSLNVLNGTIDLTSLARPELRAPSPDFLSPVQLPVFYDPTADCPAWRAFIAQTFPEDAQEFPWELVAWLMLPDISIQKAVLFLGEGANGKSTFLSALTAFLGSCNTANVSLHRLEADRFAASRLIGKLANICPDLPSAHLCGTSLFKSLTGGDPIDTERKYGDRFTFASYARLVFSANHPPVSADASHAFFRRWLCVPFTRTFDGSDARSRTELDEELSAPAELSGVLNRALAALPRLRLHGFTDAPSLTEASAEFRTATDPLSVWLEAEAVFDPAAVVSKDKLCRAYNAFCDRSGKPPIVPHQFGRAIKRLHPELQDSQRAFEGQKAWVYLGVGLKEGKPS